MKRRHLFEFEDQPWLPAMFRNDLTDILQKISGAVYRPVVPKLKQTLHTCRCRHVVDCGSGAGGPWPVLHRLLITQEKYVVKVTLTDKYPHPNALSHLPEVALRHLSYCPEPVDLVNLPDHLTGLRTFFTSFHHFPPPAALAILQDAVDTQQPIAVFEFTERRWRTILRLPIGALQLLRLGVIALFPTEGEFGELREF